jgi:hypothetical protein
MFYWTLCILFTKNINAQLNNCVLCEDNICQKGKTTSLYDTNGNCVASSTIYMDNVFITGQIFGLAACYSVQYAEKTGKNCFDSMSNHVIKQLNVNNDITSDIVTQCTTNLIRSPCSYSAAKFRAETYILDTYDCAEIAILFNNEAENCFRQSSDARFWYTLMYWIAIVFGIIICISLSCICLFERTA